MSVLTVKETVALLQTGPPTAPKTMFVERPVATLEAVTAQGPAGPAGGATYEFTQASPLDEWIINHNLGVRPSVTVLSPGGAEVEANVVHFSVNQTRVYFESPYAGSARLVG